MAFILSICCTSFAADKDQLDQERLVLSSSIQAAKQYPSTRTKSLRKIHAMLNASAKTLPRDVINKVMMVLRCGQARGMLHNNILSVIDYSLSSDKKRMWVFSLVDHKLLFHTYVSHGIKSGTLNSTLFSNRNNSKMSSIGVYSTDNAYYGRHGLSLKLHGLDRGFNDNAYNRFIVMHGSWYVNENFIKKYGRPGRSWGCPALPASLTKPIINTIKNGTIMVVYYPFDQWLARSKYLNCREFLKTDGGSAAMVQGRPLNKQNQYRSNILFADRNNDNKRDMQDPIVVVRVDVYEQLFHKKPPLGRMLRRQINGTEYIALTDTELQRLDADKNNSLDAADKDNFTQLYFVIPVIKMKRGFYATEMKIVSLGKVRAIRLVPNKFGSEQQFRGYRIQRDGQSDIHLKSSKQFIRWLGL